MLKDIIKGFLPWILYSILLGSSQEQLDLAIIAAAVTSIAFEMPALKKGFILSWGTFAFFISMLVGVVLFKNQWMIQHAWVLSNGTLAFIAWFSLLIGKPFTIQYAKEQVPAERWKHPLFIQINNIITAVWAVSFSLSVVVHILRIYYPLWNHLSYEIVSYACNLFPIAFTVWYPDWRRKSGRKKLMLETQKSPYLAGNFAPVHDELDVQNLKIIGELPKYLSGVYMRNGPNPAFPPISYTYPFDGDGMIHAIYINDSKAHYRNRFVETRELIKERKAGKALYGGIMHPIPLDPEWTDPQDGPLAIKNGAFIHIIHHANKYIAFYESAPAYEMTAQLETRGLWTPPHTKQPFEIGPHTHLDPITGELWLINYSVMQPNLAIYRLDANGNLAQTWDIAKSHSTMIHDFVLTQNYVVVFDCPVVFDIQKTFVGGSVLNWQPELGVRIGIMPKNGTQMTWFETDPFFVFHFANAYELNDEIIIDFVKHQKLEFMKKPDAQPDISPTLQRTVINFKTGAVKHIVLDDRPVEFPRLNDSINTLPHQFIYTPTKTPALKNRRAMNALIKYDVNNNKQEIHDFGIHAEIGEAVFAPVVNATAEDDGYLMLFVYDNTTEQSELCILDARNISAEPLARIVMPRRVPHGLHGSWVASSTKPHLKKI